MDRVGVLGGGAWGVSLAHHLSRHGVETRLYCHRREAARALVSSRQSPRLPGICLPESVQISDRLDDVLRGVSHVVLAVPSDACRQLAEKLRGVWPAGAILISGTKGIEASTSKLMTEVLEEVLSSELDRPLVALSGPSFALEVARGQPTSLVAACPEEPVARDVQRVLSLGRLRVYTSMDAVGVQIGGALKNVMAIAVGASDGLGLGDHARAALITRGLSEIARVAVARGGEAMTVAGLAGLGDLVLTCTGKLSRNRRVGFELGRGRTLSEVLGSLGHVAEGVTTARSAQRLSHALGVDLPISSEVSDVLFAGKTPQQAVEALLRRPLTRE